MDDKEFYLDAIRDVVPEHKEEQIQDVFYLFWSWSIFMILPLNW